MTIVSAHCCLATTHRSHGCRALLPSKSARQATTHFKHGKLSYSVLLGYHSNYTPIHRYLATVHSYLVATHYDYSIYTHCCHSNHTDTVENAFRCQATTDCYHSSFTTLPSNHTHSVYQLLLIETASTLSVVNRVLRDADQASCLEQTRNTNED